MKLHFRHSRKLLAGIQSTDFFEPGGTFTPHLTDDSRLWQHQRLENSA